MMEQAFKIGGHVRWNSEAGQVSGHTIAVHQGIALHLTDG